MTNNTWFNALFQFVLLFGIFTIAKEGYHDSAWRWLALTFLLVVLNVSNWYEGRFYK